MASDSSIVAMLGKSALTGVIGGAASHFLFNLPPGALLGTPLGEFSAPLIFGTAIALSQISGEVINHYIIPDNQKDYINNILYGFTMPALAAGAAVAVGYFAFSDGVDVKVLLKLGAISAGSVVASDYVYDNFLASMFK